MRKGVKFPPITAFFDGNTYWLADGEARGTPFADSSDTGQSPILGNHFRRCAFDPDRCRRFFMEEGLQTGNLLYIRMGSVPCGDRRDSFEKYRRASQDLDRRPHP